MECLITKLKGSVNDGNLLKIGELRFKVFVTGADSASKFTLSPSSGNSISISILNGKQLKFNSSLFSQRTLTSQEEYIFPDDGEYEISIDNKYNIRTFFISNASLGLENFNFGMLKYSKDLNYLQVIGKYGDDIDFGSIDDLPSSLKSLYIMPASKDGNTSDSDYPVKVSGDISNLFARKELESIQLNVRDTNIEGEIVNISSESINRISISRNPKILLNLNSSYRFPSLMYLLTFDLAGDVYAENFANVNINSSDTKTVNIKSNTDNNVLNFHGDLKNSFLSATGIKSVIAKNVTGDTTWTLDEINKNIGFISTAWNIEITSVSRIKCKWNGGTSDSNRQYILACEQIDFESGASDFIKAMSTKTVDPNIGSSSFYKKIEIYKVDDKSSEEWNSDSELQNAISTLSGKGISVVVYYFNSNNINSISLMSASLENRYAIIYKEKILISEPVSLSSGFIAPANDCEYMEFSSLEEADTYIRNNGLVRTNS